MDNTTIDSLIRSFRPTGTRRGALFALLGAFGMLGVSDVDAKHRKNKKRKHKTTCRCPRNRVRLRNDTCAAVCAADEDCPAMCRCADPFDLVNVEGRRHCVPPITTCDAIPQACSSTADCPFGQVCEWTRCLGEPYRCVALCG